MCFRGMPFTNLAHLTDDTLVPGNPDLYYGARPEHLDRRVRNELSGRINPLTQVDLPMAPDFFLAAKGPDGFAAVAKRQASYDCAHWEQEHTGKMKQPRTTMLTPFHQSITMANSICTPVTHRNQSVVEIGLDIK